APPAAIELQHHRIAAGQVGEPALVAGVIRQHQVGERGSGCGDRHAGPSARRAFRYNRSSRRTAAQTAVSAVTKSTSPPGPPKAKLTAPGTAMVSSARPSGEYTRTPSGADA